MKKKILLVDDNKGQRVTLETILNRSGFEVISADCGSAALSLVEKNDLAAALLDIKMPDMTGIDVLKQLKSQKPDVTVIMMTGFSETQYAIDALNAGASAYLLKPANIEQIKALLKQAVEFQRMAEENKAMSLALREFNGHLEIKVRKRTEQLEEAYRMTLSFYEEIKKNFESTLEVLSIAIDQRDHLTCAHSFRVTQYALVIGKILNLNEDDQEKLRYAGLMHDLGKIQVRGEVLCKTGSLTSEEYKEIQTHASGTFDLLSRFKFKNNLADVPLIASSHHERIDGKGYPNGLKGDAIPYLAKILAVADVLDAITSKRHYRTAMSISSALSIFKRETDAHFDKVCVESLFKMKIADFIKIHMAGNLSLLNASDLINLNNFTLEELNQACEVNSPSAIHLEMIQQVYNYYQGPVPPHLEGKIKPAPRIENEESEINC